MNLIEEALTDQWGERCPDYVAGCPCCDAWKLYDDLVAKPKEVLKEAIRTTNWYHGERVTVPCPDGIKGCLVYHCELRPSPAQEALEKIDTEV